MKYKKVVVKKINAKYINRIITFIKLKKNFRNKIKILKNKMFKKKINC